MGIYLRLFLYRLALLLGTFVVCRLVFLALNAQLYAGVPLPDLFLALLHGLRFDLSAMAMLNGLFVVLSLLPFGLLARKDYQQLLKWTFLIFNLPFIWLSVADAAYFGFTGRRSTIALLGIKQDIAEQGAQLAGNYWGLVLLSLGLAWLLAYFFPRLRLARPPSPNRLLNWLPLLLAVPLAVLAIRGGLQLKPLRVNHAFALPPAPLGHLTLNSAFTFIKSASAQQLVRKRYFPAETALQNYLKRTAPAPLPQPKGPRPNVVLIILESFAAEYTGIGNSYQGYTPFLDSLARHSLAFGAHYANGRRSIEALPALLAGIPSLMEEPYITSPYRSNTLYGLGNVLLRNGYHTSFFHGATNGSMGFGNFSKIIGIEHYYGLNQYPHPKRDYDGTWGIFDEPYLQYFAQQLSRFPQPFLSCVFTLSSHQPYTIPPQHRGKFPKGELPVHESIGYADLALREFFRKAAQQRWYSNTLFIITGDHTQQNARPEYRHFLGSYRVPLLFFQPGQRLPAADTAQVTQHADVPASVLHYLGLEQELLPFGRSVFDHSTPGKALLYEASQYYLVQPPYVVVLPEEERNARFYLYPTDTTMHQPVPANQAASALEKRLKALVQYFNNGLLDNSWFALPAKKRP